MKHDLSKDTGGHVSRQQGHNRRQLFDRFPFFVTRIVPGLYDIILLPADMDEVSLVGFAEGQAGRNHLDACLVMNQDSGLWFTPDGRKSYSQRTPWGGILITGALKSYRQFHMTQELLERTNRLDVIVQEVRHRGGYIHGDWIHGGHPASAQELDELSGKGSDGVPKGLVECPACGDWRGECLGTAERYREIVLPVHCLCENDNRCARCGNRLHARRLNSNYFEPSDGHLWYVPGFCCFQHRCPG